MTRLPAAAGGTERQPQVPDRPPVEDRLATSRVGLFIVWSKGRTAEDRILEDLAGRFEVLHAYEVHWTPSLVARNFRRFYNDIRVRGATHQQYKGGDPFLAVTVLDGAPVIEERETARGRRLVNSHFLEAKLLYRDWTDPSVIHGGEDDRENRRDITMLLGEAPQAHLEAAPRPWDGRVEALRRDVAGAHGWASVDEAIRILNDTVPYLVLEPDGRALPNRDAGPLELLTDRYLDLVTVLDARAGWVATPPEGGRFRMRVADRSVPVIVRHVDDGLLDPRWAAELLASRERDLAGWYRPSVRDAWEVRLYRALMHRPRLTRSQRERLAAEGAAVGAATPIVDALAHPHGENLALDALLARRGFAHVRPRDPFIPYGYERVGQSWGGARRAADRVRGSAKRLTRAFGSLLVDGYKGARDRLLLVAPWARRVRRAIPWLPH